MTQVENSEILHRLGRIEEQLERLSATSGLTFAELTLDTKESRNPFKIVDDKHFPGGRVQLGRQLGGPPHFLGLQISTCLRVAYHPRLSPERSAAPVLWLEDLLWAPDIGTTIRLHEPSRDATVVAQMYEINPTGVLWSNVYISDPETAPRKRRS